MSENDFNSQVIEEFRANEGKVGGYFAEQDVLLLTTTGAKSGQPRLIPLVYTRSGDDYVVIASKAGADTHPDWYHNLRANPEVTAEVGTESFAGRARVTEEPERTELYNRARDEDAGVQGIPGGDKSRDSGNRSGKPRRIMLHACLQEGWQESGQVNILAHAPPRHAGSSALSVRPVCVRGFVARRVYLRPTCRERRPRQPERSTNMAYAIVHHFPGGTKEQYEASIAAVHPSRDSLPTGQIFHAAGAAAGGWTIVAVWDSKESWETFRDGILMPSMQAGIEGGFTSPPQAPQETAFDVHNLQTSP